VATPISVGLAAQATPASLDRCSVAAATSRICPRPVRRRPRVSDGAGPARVLVDDDVHPPDAPTHLGSFRAGSRDSRPSRSHPVHLAGGAWNGPPLRSRPVGRLRAGVGTTSWPTAGAPLPAHPDPPRSAE